MKKWFIQNQSVMGKNGLSDEAILGILLKNRGISSDSDIEKFLHPQIENITLENVGVAAKSFLKAVGRIEKSIKYKESVVVYTDYDVDGICSGAIVWETMHNLGAKIMPYVPHRMKEGYGLSKYGIDQVKQQFNPQLIITVDHGVSSYEEVAYAKRLGIDIIILDHHTLPEKIPPAYALIHTTELVATGIAWLFCYSMTVHLGSNKKIQQQAFHTIDLAAFATIADLAPLVDSNRAIVKIGLETLRKTNRIGLVALISESQINQKTIGVYEIGHILGPRINAVGRMDHALDALRLLCTQSQEKAASLARSLSSVNKTRQLLTESSYNFALQMVRDDLSYSQISTQAKNKIIVISHQSFHEGIIGLIAGKLVEEFYLPAIVIAEDKTYAKASARSITGFDIVKALRSVSDVLIQVGGHPMAAGFSIEKRNIQFLKQKITQTANEMVSDELLHKIFKIDLVLDLELITYHLYRQICKLEPFGMGNPEPTFVSYRIELIGIKLIGRQQNHIKMKLKKGNVVFEAVAFNLGHMFHQLTIGSYVDIAYTIKENNWNNNRNLQLNIRDVKIAS